MEESHKKILAVVIAIVCLASAGIVTWVTKEKTSGVSSIPRSEQIWVKCINPDCQAEYQMGKRDYFERAMKERSPDEIGLPLLPCEKCGKKSLCRAVKCEKCGYVFARGSVDNDFEDRCPKCRYSKVEEGRKRR